MERQLNNRQRYALEFIANTLVEEDGPLTILKDPLAEEFGLSLAELNQIIGIVGLTLHHVDRRFEGDGLPKVDRRRFAAMIINNPPGSRQAREEKQGKFHTPKGYFSTGRNHSGQRRAGRK